MEHQTPTARLSDHRERGATLVEYALLVALVAAVSIVGLRLVGGGAESGLVAAGAGLSRSAPVGAPGGGDAPLGSGGSGSDGADSEQAAAEQAAAEKAAAEKAAAEKAAAEKAAAEKAAAEQAAAEQAAKDAAAASTMTSVSASVGWGTLTWWDSWGDQGQWVAATTFTNAWARPSYLTVEVTRVWGDGKTTKEKIRDFYVPAQGSATLEYWDNDVDLDSKASDDVVQVRFEVVQIKTYDLQWKSQTINVDGATSTALVPAVE